MLTLKSRDKFDLNLTFIFFSSVLLFCENDLFEPVRVCLAPNPDSVLVLQTATWATAAPRACCRWPCAAPCECPLSWTARRSAAGCGRTGAAAARSASGRQRDTAAFLSCWTVSLEEPRPNPQAQAARTLSSGRGGAGLGGAGRGGADGL